MKQTKDYTIPLIGFIILIAVLASACSTSRYNQESVYLKEGGELDKFHTRCQLMAVKRGPMGFTHIFVADSGDTLRRVYDKRLAVDSCYYIRKTRTEK